MRCARPSTIGGLADAGLADEHRVVLRAARQHLDHAADLLVAADDRIELAAARELGQIAAVALERLVLAFGVLVGDALRCRGRCVSASKIAVARDAVFASAAARAGERPASAAIATNRCSVLTNSSLQPSRLRPAARSTTSFSRGETGGVEPPYACGSLDRPARAGSRHLAGSTFIFRSSAGTMPSGCSTSATSRCSGSTCA